MLNNFIIKLFNIESAENLDLDKSDAHIYNTNKSIDIYLTRYIFDCPKCNGTKLYSKGTEKEIISTSYKKRKV